MSLGSLKVFIYGVHNLFDLKVLKGKVVYPEALNNLVRLGKDSYSFKWKLDT